MAYDLSSASKGNKKGKGKGKGSGKAGNSATAGLKIAKLGEAGLLVGPRRMWGYIHRVSKTFLRQ
eukprot:11844780-Alexandrium_andersonii.AAC.1